MPHSVPSRRGGALWLRLARLSQQPEPPAPLTAATLLYPLMQQMDETVLPRRLTLCAEGTPIATFDVVRRALVAMTWVSDSAQDPKGKATDHSVAGLAASLLNRVAALPATERLSIESKAATIRPSADQCDVILLRHALGLAEPDGPLPDPLAAAQAEALAVAWLAPGGDRARHLDLTSAFTPMLEATLAQASVGTRRTVGRLAIHPSRACLRLMELAPGLVLAVAERPETLCALILTERSARALAEQWARSSH